MNLVRQLTLVLIIAETTACFPVSVRPDLAHQKPTALANAPTSRDLVGYQFALLVIPLGRVYLQAPAEGIKAALVEGFDRHGLPQPDHLMVAEEETDASLTAYDLLFTRYITVSVSSPVDVAFYGQRDSRLNKGLIFTCAHQEFSHFGFRADLERALTRCLRAGADSFFSTFGVSSGRKNSSNRKSSVLFSN